MCYPNNWSWSSSLGLLDNVLALRSLGLCGKLEVSSRSCLDGHDKPNDLQLSWSKMFSVVYMILSQQIMMWYHQAAIGVGWDHWSICKEPLNCTLTMPYMWGTVCSSGGPLSAAQRVHCLESRRTIVCRSEGSLFWVKDAHCLQPRRSTLCS